MTALMFQELDLVRDQTATQALPETTISNYKKEKEKSVIKKDRWIKIELSRR